MPTVFITGGHKGLGLRAVERIAKQGGFDLILGGRDLPEVQAVVESLRRGGANARAVALDVSSLASVRKAADDVKTMVRNEEVASLKVLMLNAGAQFLGDVEFSADGFEKTFATNCLGSFLLLNLLLPEIVQGGRVVFTASGTHDPATMDGKMVGVAVEPDARALATQGKLERAIPGGKRYATSKLCTILYAYELARRLRAADTKVESIAFDPGLIVETGLIRSAPPVAQRIMRTSFAKRLFRTLGVTMGSIPFSGDALADIAISPKFADASGKYIQSHNGRLIEARSSVASYDETSARKLWVDSEALVGLSMAERSQTGLLATPDFASAA